MRLPQSDRMSRKAELTQSTSHASTQDDPRVEVVKNKRSWVPPVSEELKLLDIIILY